VYQKTETTSITRIESEHIRIQAWAVVAPQENGSKRSCRLDVNPAFNGQRIRQLECVGVRNHYSSAHAVETETLADFTQVKCCTAEQRSIVPSDNVVSMPIPRPPGDESGRRRDTTRRRRFAFSSAVGVVNGLDFVGSQSAVVKRDFVDDAFEEFSESDRGAYE